MGKLAPEDDEQDGARIVTLDIETAPLESYHWGIWEQNINLEMIREDWTILAFCAKWLDSQKVIYQDTGGRGVSKVRDDKKLLHSLWDILDEADVVVTQNGRQFDIKRINARLIQAGFKPYSPIKVVDTKVAAKRHFAFTSNKLAWLSSKLARTRKDEHKKFPGFDLWAECLKDNRAAWAEMRHYNTLDVLATEQVYLALRPWIVGHPNLANYTDVEEEACPKCGSYKVQRRGHERTQSGLYARLQCQTCGGWSRSRYTANTTAKRKILLSN